LILLCHFARSALSSVFDLRLARLSKSLCLEHSSLRITSSAAVPGGRVSAVPVNGAKFLAQQGLVDLRRVVISGGSAGGYTTLAALAFRDFFQGGASYYGVSDAAALARDTHKLGNSRRRFRCAATPRPLPRWFGGTTASSEPWKKMTGFDSRSA
jgi:Prolyl oligopeptidase family